MNRQRWRASRISAGALILLLVSGITLAVHDIELFELEGNTVQDTIADDASQIYCDHFPADKDCLNPDEGPSPVQPSAALVSTFAIDKVEDPTDDIFDGATDSKNLICDGTPGLDDPGGCSDWGWKVGEPNDKNDIQNFFAALYREPDGDYYLYFGLDKLDNSGDDAIGFWFFQNKVELQADGSFSVAHTAGDVLVQSDLTGGGLVSRVDVYTWGPNGFDNDPVQPSQGYLTRALANDQCDPLVTDDPACGIVNPGDPGDPDLGVEWAPWTHKFKGSGGVVTSDPARYPIDTYFEGGINLSAFFPDGIPCIESFIVETRQSQSETAQLEDLGLAGFELCSVTADKDGPEKSKVGDDAQYTVTIENDGALPLTVVSIVDSLAGDLTDPLNYDASDCGMAGEVLEPGVICTIAYTRTVQAGDPDPLVNTVTIEYNRGDDTFTDSSSHTVDLVQPAISLDKTAEGSDGPLTVLRGATIDYAILLENLSSADTPPLECTIEDGMLGISEPALLSSGADVTVGASKSFADPGTFTNTATALCSPQGFTNELSASDSVTIEVLPDDNVLMVSKTGDAYSKVGDAVDYTVTVTNIGSIDVTLTSLVDDVLGDLLDNLTNPFVTGGDCSSGLLLAPTASCTVTATRTTVATDPDPLVNVVTATVEDDFGGSASRSDDHSVDLVAPDYTLAKTCASEEPVPAGASANFRIDIVNTGDVDLLLDVDDPTLSIAIVDLVLGARAGAPCAEDDWGDGSNGCLRIEAGVIATGDQVLNTVTTLATLPDPYAAVLPNELEASETAVCEVADEDQATRTLGFWKTHGSNGDDLVPPFGYTCHVAEDSLNHVGFPIDLGWKTLLNCEDVFGVFWSSPARQSDDDRRSNLCRTQLQASWQLLAAILNDGLSNGAPVPTDPDTGLSIIDAMVAALAAGDRREIIRLKGLLDAYNQSGDDVMIIDLDGTMIPHADPNGTREVADYTAGDCN